MGQFSSTSKHRHIAYQIKANKEWNMYMILYTKYYNRIVRTGQYNKLITVSYTYWVVQKVIPQF